ncbi:hypothetical protein O0I10_003341 [Lichtheimia ornata]|uniref:AMP-dependent synthetase/ligase domain-containing protein n=1 Tax=Lichtheimia ornata TaxID=688661 RepID=A0AAD7Y1I7_9FUNG|nr:uncharacterized protein O0I10_003341 [Lichtheimia ornata]KAJ8661118.1 hypothetical protein O0I10_003341 [Lichtheimia ornata]
MGCSLLPSLGVQPSLYNHLFESRAKRYVNDDAPLFIDAVGAKRFLSFAQLRNHVRAFAAHLIDQGVQQGDIVAICAPGAIEYPIVMHGVIASGGVAMLVPDALIGREIAALFKMAKPAMVVTHAKTQLAVQEAIHACNLHGSTHVVVMDNSLLLHKDASSLVKTPAMYVDPDAAAILLVTSGSTGPPKLVTVSHRAAIARAEVSSSHFLPLMHDGYDHRVLVATRMGGAVQVHNALLAGVQLGLPHYVYQTINLHAVCRLVERHRITALYHFGWVTAQLAHDPIIHTFDMSSLQYWITGGQVVSRHVANQATRALLSGCRSRGQLPRVLCNYGSSEAHNIFYYRHASDGSWQVIPQDGFQIKLVDDLGKVLKEPNTVGELCIKSPMGYYNNPNATLEAFDDDGFFHTGDLFTSDANNNLRFVNRKSERIKRFTKDICPRDIEEICIMFSDLIQECRVVGAYDARRCLEVPRAYVILARDHECDKEQFAKELIQFVNARVPDPEMRLEGGVQFVMSWPLTTAGKMDLFGLRKRAQIELLQDQHYQHGVEQQAGAAMMAPMTSSKL